MSRQFPKRPRNAIVAMQLRIPEYLRRQLAEVAAANMRSLNSECVNRLMASLGTELTERPDTTSRRVRSSPSLGR